MVVPKLFLLKLVGLRILLPLSGFFGGKAICCFFGIRCFGVFELVLLDRDRLDFVDGTEGSAQWQFDIANAC